MYDPPNFSWPGGAHAAVVEVDTETGDVDSCRYVAVDDVGTVINPMIVDGQVHGGVAQGVAQALYEEAVYDEDGNLVTGSMTTTSCRRRRSCRRSSSTAPRAEPDEPAGREGGGRDGRDRVDGGGDERGRRRAGAVRRHRHRRCPPRPSGSGGRWRRQR